MPELDRSARPSAPKYRELDYLLSLRTPIERAAGIRRGGWGDTLGWGWCGSGAGGVGGGILTGWR